MSIPLGQGERSCLYVTSSTPLASQCSQSRCNTGKLAGSTSPSFHSPTGLPGYLQMKMTKKKWPKAGCGWDYPQRHWNKTRGTIKERQVPTRIICWNMWKTTHRIGRRNLLGERKWAEQQEPPSNCPNHSFGQCLSNSGSPLKISAIDWGGHLIIMWFYQQKKKHKISIHLPLKCCSSA